MTDVIGSGDSTRWWAPVPGREGGDMETTDNAVIDVRGLTCTYGDFTAVRDLDLTVRRGELFALLGTNGAGKTTTMETLEGHRAADAGRVRVLGMDPVADRARLRPRLGIMLQESGFAGDLTVRETVDLWASLTTNPRRTDDALERLGLADRAGTRVVQLSGGQRRRLDLILATLNNPEVLFLDEPSAGLDPESREAAWRFVADLKAGGTTVVLTTHYLEEAEALADHVAIMHEGRVATEGSVSDVVGTAPAAIEFTTVGLAGADLDRELRTVVDPVSLRITADRVRLDVADLQSSLGRLLRWADQHGHRLERLNASEASLSEIFTRVSHSSNRLEDAS
ncbi:ABC transporter ATP-binding protein [Aeromicrobium tamlense]|uniref:ABC transporter ATP-binding protein n=2 Tax=Aeromicrobium tamlense TaxID=375541 RepID=A0A8I0FT76_9ACTN|nr:ABC transporter ATP-binding protein [Aeromicrobium tamlense]